MTDRTEKPPTTPRTDKSPGYRGALPPRNDVLARTWVAIVGLVLILVFVLPLLDIPSSLFPEPTEVPIPSIPVPSASGSLDALPSESP
jgi:hypothetical protein